MYGTAVRHTVLRMGLCGLILRIRTLVRVHLYRAVRTKVRSRIQLTRARGDGNSSAVDPDVAVEGGAARFMDLAGARR